MSTRMRRVVSSGVARFVAGLLVSLAALFSPLPAAAQSYTWRNVEIVGGGFVPGIVFNTSEPNLIYARTDIGGAYRWNPSTSRWIPLLDFLGFDDWNLTGVDSIATDPVDPNRVYVLAGTYTNAWTSQNGAILRSADRGNTWQRTMLPFKSGGNMPGRNMGERLMVDPNRNATLYLGARNGNGLWRSTDFGATWARVTSFTATGSYAQDPNDPNGYLSDRPGVVWVVFDPRTGTPGNATQTIYAGVADLGTSIYRSTNGGATWSALPGQPTGFLPHHAVLGSTGILYVTYSNKGGPYDGEKGDVWKFDTASGAWTLISPVPSTSADDYFGYGGLAVDAQDPDTIMVAALNSWWPDTILFRSTNAGASWTRIWDWAAFPERTLRYTLNITAAPWLVFTDINPVPPVPSPKLGWMVGDLEIDPFNSNRMLYGTGATIYGSDNLTNWDAGGTIAISVRAQGLEETAVLDLISPPSGPPLLSGLGDINGFRHDSLTTVPARMFNTPSIAGTSLDFAELTPNFIVRVGNVDKTLNPSINRCGFSFDSGANWFQGQEPGGVTGGGTVAAAANASRVVWAPDGAAVHFSTTNGSSWTQSTGIPNGARVGSDRVNPMKFYGFANATFYVSTNGGQSFSAQPAGGLPASGRFKAVAGREGDIWLAGGTEGGIYGIWHSTNSGASFTKLANVEEADNIGLGMPAPGQSYPALYTSAQIGGVRGLYRSDDAGASWVRINDDSRQWGFTGGAITGDPRVYGRVFVATNGRGIIWGEPGTAGPNFSLSANPNSLVVGRGASVTSAVTIARTGGFTSSVALSASGLPAGVTASFSPASTTGASSTLTLTASSTATAGPATVTVTGVGGGLTRTTTIGLTVNAPDFSLAANPTSLSINRGASGSSTLSITRTGGFTSSLTCSFSGLPAGVGASCNPATITGNSAVLTFTASATAAVGPATVVVSLGGGGISRSISFSLTVAAPDFTIGPGCVLSIPRGSSGTCSINITRTGGFTSSVAFSLSAAPAGVTASFNPTSTTGNSTQLSISVGATAPLGTSNPVVTASGGGLVRTTPVTLTITDGQQQNFTLAANPASVTINRGASGTSSINITRSGGFTGSVAFTAGGAPSGVSASFAPSSTTGNSVTLNISASSTATLGNATLTITGTGTLNGASATRTTSVALTVNDGSNTGGVSVTPAVTSNSPWFNEQVIRLGNTANVTALSITIVIQRTPGVSFSGQYNTVGGQITQSNSSTTAAVTYQFALAAGQTLGPATNRIFAAQTSGNGSLHPTSGDSYTVTYTTGGQNFTQSGNFP